MYELPNVRVCAATLAVLPVMSLLPVVPPITYFVDRVPDWVRFNDHYGW
jgi:hypothetical protein